MTIYYYCWTWWQSVCRCRRSAWKWPNVSKQWMECVSDLTLFLGSIVFGLDIGRHRNVSQHIRPFLWTVLPETDRCLRRNLNHGPIKHFDGIYGVKFIRLFLFSKEIPTQRQTTDCGCALVVLILCPWQTTTTTTLLLLRHITAYETDWSYRMSRHECFDHHHCQESIEYNFDAKITTKTPKSARCTI